ncbi:MAG: 3-isopropylmalate dehydratase small subunit [Thermoleophilaceae bacterium]|nr:3-isopropylmalate dehydratase small subunit [Thermoleophilaceae bacterium]
MEKISQLTGGVTVVDRSDVDTDQIIPKQFLKRIERTGFGEFLFFDWRKEPGFELPVNPILVTGRNFGCGSSREHAPWALLDFGFKVIIAPSFADIFYSNCAKNGMVLVALPEDQVQELAKASEITVDLEAQTVAAGGKSYPFEIDAEIRNRLINGLDDISITLANASAIDQYESTRERQGPDTRIFS